MAATAWNLKKLMQTLKEKFLQLVFQLFFPCMQLPVSPDCDIQHPHATCLSGGQGRKRTAERFFYRIAT
jgi:hypothetical protein